MATTHDLRYEEERRSTWAWLIPLALLVVAAIALAAYVANNDATTLSPTLSDTQSGIIAQ